MSLAFSTQGAVPKTPGLLGFNPANQGQKAMSSFGVKTPEQTNPNYGKVTGVLAPQKLGTNPGMLPTTPVKKITSPDGTTHEFHAPVTDTKTSTPQPTPTTPTVGSPQNNAQNVLNAGTQTPNESATQQSLLQSGQMTPWETAAANNVMQAKGIQNFGQFAPYAEAGMHAGDNAGQLGNLITAPDLAGRSAADTGLYNAFSNLYGTQANVGLQAAQTAAGRNETATSSAYTGAQNQANRGLTGANSVLSASLPGQQGTSSQLYNPLEGAQGGTSITSGANRQSAYDQQQQLNNLTGVNQQAKGLSTQLTNLIQTSGVNPSPVTYGNQLAQFLAGKGGDPQYQQLNNLMSDVISRYAQILTPSGGSTTNQVRDIADGLINRLASGQNIIQVVKSLDDQANSVIGSLQNNIQELQSGKTGTSNSGGQSSGGSNGGTMFGSFF